LLTLRLAYLSVSKSALMKTFIDDLKQTWHKPNNGLVQLIVINVIVFVCVNIIWVFAALFKAPAVFAAVQYALFIPAPITEFITRPWTLFTYFFTHQDFFDILFSMLGLYWFGRIIHEYLGNPKVISLYIYGGVMGGICYLILLNTIPTLDAIGSEVGVVGARASVYAIAVAAATLVPNLTLHLLFLGPVQLKYVVAVYVFLAFISLAGANAGASVAYLGGAVMGYIFIAFLQKGKDLGKPIWIVLHGIQNLFRPKPTIKVKQRATAGGAKASRNEKYSAKSTSPTQDEIDEILDKISAYGYEALTTEEKQILFKASQRK
jgi:membrane associated rhomboid family serine protease